MFDDYEYKQTNKRISARFVQEVDEPMYPWEIAGFLNKFNTVYYKYELLNSICSAINHGIDPKEIFIFDKSLPLYEQYSEMNLISEENSAALFYHIGLPYPLVPNEEVYKFNFLLQFFRTINSFLLEKHVKPLGIKNINEAYKILQESDLAHAESYVIDLAERRALKSTERARHNLDPISREEIANCLTKQQTNKLKLFDDIHRLEATKELELLKLVESKKKEDKRLATVLLSFFNYFDKTARPLVCVRVSPGKFRVLGRSLVNKREQTGLEVKEVTRNSPLGAIIQGGVAILQATLQEQRANEIHQLDIEKRNLEIQEEKIRIKIAEENLKTAQLTALQKEIEVAQEIKQLVSQSDIQAFDSLPDSFTKHRLLRAYAIEEKNAKSLMHNRGLALEQSSIKVIDIQA